MFEESDANFSGIKDKVLSTQIAKSQFITDTKTRAKTYQEITKYIKNMCVIKPLFTLPAKRVYVRKTLLTPGIGLISIDQYYFGNITN